MLQGPVGCGKTTLVEYLGKLTGRHKVPELLKIQLGDQTDNKVSILELQFSYAIYTLHH